jgi:predicted nucleic acid-binding protein
VPDYLDTSAFLKLVVPEAESAALRTDVSSGGDLVSSALLLVEGRRAAARYGPRALQRAEAGIAAVTLLALDEAVLERAAVLEPPTPRSLDALHLASALDLGGDLGRFYCYDERLSAAARELGIDVRTPGAA